jgi:signal transduction histidine kinase/ActR/RegA family two-component response regulator
MERSVTSEAGRGDRLRVRYSQFLGSDQQSSEELQHLLKMAQAIRDGDFSCRYPFESGGTLAEIGNVLTQLSSNLKETTRKNQEQDWLKTNLARFSSMMQGQRDLSTVAQLIMSELTPLAGAQQGAFFHVETEGEEVLLKLIGSYAFKNPESAPVYRLKEGLIGQCGYEKKRIMITQASNADLRISTSFVQTQLSNVVLLPVLFEGELKAVIELASLQPLGPNCIQFLDQLSESIGVIMNMISSSMRTEILLQELKRSNVELETQAKELEDKAKLLQIKNSEIELASRALEEKALQLTMISNYKSEFLANMSHELRTPLNSLLILSKSLADNKEKNLTPVQVTYAKTVNSAGQDLLALINEILDLSKVEAGKMQIDPARFNVQDLIDHLQLTFRPVAEQKNLEFQIQTDPDVPEQMFSDETRILQVLKNLLANAFKFTASGLVNLKISLDKLDRTTEENSMLVFSVTDTGIGIAKDNLKLIFEAFQQADGTTSRRYGGTGLGLTISREIAQLLGGRIEVDSEPGRGSKFRFFLPQKISAVEAPEFAQKNLPDREASLQQRPVNLMGRKVLVVDDDVRNIFAMSSLLRSYGIEVFHAENGKQAIELLEMNSEIELVLMDTMMPEMDGLEATKRIRQNLVYQKLPIISLTAKAMKGDREKCLEAGASDYVMKPVDEHSLLMTISRWLTEGRNAK